MYTYVYTCNYINVVVLPLTCFGHPELIYTCRRKDIRTYVYMYIYIEREGEPEIVSDRER